MVRGSVSLVTHYTRGKGNHTYNGDEYGAVDVPEPWRFEEPVG